MRKFISLILLGGILLLIGCNAAKIREGETVGEYFARGQTAFDTGKYKLAIKIFDNILDQFPYSAYTILAQLRKAEALYRTKDYLESLVILENFQYVHPKHVEIDKVIYLIGMCYFNQMETKDRDQTNTRKALNYLETLVSSYPDSVHRSDALIKIKLARQRLAENELYVGKFYYRNQKYSAAVQRLENLVDTYKDTDVVPEALLYLAKSYKKMRYDKNAEKVYNILKRDYPAHKFTESAADFF